MVTSTEVTVVVVINVGSVDISVAISPSVMESVLTLFGAVESISTPSSVRGISVLVMPLKPDSVDAI